MKFAFSRPGFLTFKATDASIRPGSFQLVSTFARAWGWSLGKSSNDDLHMLASDIADLIATTAGDLRFTNLHCWQRDSAIPGRNDFEPGITPAANVAGQALGDLLRPRIPDLQLNQLGNRGDLTLCVVLVEPTEWWFGWHNSATVSQGWPGGVPQIQLPERAASRAWLKMHEAVLWGHVPIRECDIVAEIGSAPGGAAQYLLECGATVVAIDPAEMDPVIAAHPSLVHVRCRARNVPKRDLFGVRWLAIDINMPPSYTIEVIRDYVQNRRLDVQGVIATLKLPDWKLAEEVDRYRQEFVKMGLPFVRTRQLAFNRQEFCLVAMPKQSRPRRSKRNAHSAQQNASHEP